MRNITISQEEYDELIRDRKWVEALEQAGIDNWEGYAYALEIYRDELED
jgi:hypothetical protein